MSDNAEPNAVKMRLRETCRTSAETRYVFEPMAGRDNLPDDLVACKMLCIVVPRDEEPDLSNDVLPGELFQRYPVYGGPSIDGVLAFTFEKPPSEMCRDCDECEFRHDCDAYDGSEGDDIDPAGNEFDPEFN